MAKDRNVGMKSLQHVFCMSRRKSQSLSNLLVDYDVDFDASLSGSL